MQVYVPGELHGLDERLSEQVVTRGSRCTPSEERICSTIR